MARWQRGFTLLEVLVVVTLIALTSAILVPALLRVNTTAPADVADQLADTLTELSERSLFLGQVTALEITPQSYMPFYYDVATSTFLPFNETTLQSVTLPESITLAWQPDDSQLEKQVVEGIEQAESSAQKLNEKVRKTVPQIYFLPGGQASSGRLILTAADGKVSRLALDALGQVQRLDRKKDAESGALENGSDLPPLLLPDDTNFYRTLEASP